MKRGACRMRLVARVRIVIVVVSRAIRPLVLRNVMRTFRRRLCLRRSVASARLVRCARTVTTWLGVDLARFLAFFFAFPFATSAAT